ncbi:hypothetical protein PHYSODRAFT_477685 [Phytophthora sojae]|uniref:Protein kinase domain-containing protein n=1 Tax=Phytophthora sojae (strain P6497) TaxID=1094619 RepID=G4YGP0_PHYSP|nr:hypothetical protein PHYSODRAFT_477685 [Phytophthora sojae]EGZ27003.1 hypothetical protein PHYSODRAFT_477685 [Phytophthora sojae]|eukprot:XP_009514278.1 hypothetical protein PHYSODRAFT_477685 [Phytophthora sojae]
MYSISASYLGDKCGGTPHAVNIVRDDSCAPQTCQPSRLSSGDVETNDYSSDYVEVTRDKFSHSPFVLAVVFVHEGCTNIVMGFGCPASGTCTGGYNETDYAIARLNKDGSASIEFYSDRSCSSASLNSIKSGDKAALTTHECDVNLFKWYSSNNVEDVSGSNSTADSALSTGTIVAIVCGCVAAIFFIVVLSVCYRRRNQWNPKQQWTSTEGLDDADSLEAATRYNRGLWNDEIIIAKKLPRDKVKIQKLISRGAFGEVYAGQLHRNQVAVKMLLPATRNSLKHVDDFLAEAKMTAVMDHPHVVSFIGVAWDSLSDVCVVLEFMDGGDLRTLLNKYETSKHPVGFDKQKATIALHVCHALTYLHSLAPPVIHRDLKSRNILLNKAMHAKLTDFGISRERLDQTMTAGMGTSLWMAPEVMLGERYDVKADMFSFGVVLSELDVHTLPYAQEKKRSLDSGGRALADATLLQRVAEGTVRVEFSEGNASFITELGCACVSVDPSQRPSAAEALYKLQLVLAQGLQQLTL